jgi:hypothetical protein
MCRHMCVRIAPSQTKLPAKDDRGEHTHPICGLIQKQADGGARAAIQRLPTMGGRSSARADMRRIESGRLLVKFRVSVAYREVWVEHDLFLMPEMCKQRAVFSTRSSRQCTVHR